MANGRSRFRQFAEAPKQATIIATIALVLAAVAVILVVGGGSNGA